MDSILQAAEKEPPLSDLDDERAARIARNQQMLQTLGVPAAANGLKSVAKKPAKRPRTSAEPSAEAAAAPARRSSRAAAVRTRERIQARSRADVTSEDEELRGDSDGGSGSGEPVQDTEDEEAGTSDASEDASGKKRRKGSVTPSGAGGGEGTPKRGRARKGASGGTGGHGPAARGGAASGGRRGRKAAGGGAGDGPAGSGGDAAPLESELLGMWVMLAEGAEGHEQERRVLTIAGIQRVAEALSLGAFNEQQLKDMMEFAAEKVPSLTSEARSLDLQQFRGLGPGSHDQSWPSPVQAQPTNL
eukprot:XP_001690180.1 predicted protein [Chlamydomonas reinhardtii]